MSLYFVMFLLLYLIYYAIRLLSGCQGQFFKTSSFAYLQSDTLNPFDVNGQIFNGNVCDSEKELSCDKEKKDDENNVVLTNEQVALLEDQRQELADLRRQVVFLQVSLKFSAFHEFFMLFCLQTTYWHEIGLDGRRN